ncbi:putative reverse transcriptase domain-containing protein, partial [Tanacetum coccineum]
ESFLCVNDVLLAMLVSVQSSATSVESLGTKQGHTRNRCPKKIKQEEAGEVHGRAYAIKDVEPQGLNVVTGASYEVDLADGRVVSMNTVLKDCTLNLVNRVFEIDLMLIELGTFDVIISMDWLVKYDVVIICGEKVVRIPYGNKVLIVESDKGVSRLKVIPFIKASKCVERGCHLFLAHVTENTSKEKQMENVPVIHDFPEELLGLPPPRQVEFRIDLVPGAAPVARASYRLASSKMRDLSVQLQELLEKGFIHPSLASWGAPVLFLKKKDGSFRISCTLRSICDQDITSNALKKMTFQLLHLELVFIDDILVYSKNDEEHEKHLRIILELLKEEKFGVHVDPAKIEAIKSWAAL